MEPCGAGDKWERRGPQGGAEQGSGKEASVSFIIVCHRALPPCACQFRLDCLNEKRLDLVARQVIRSIAICPLAPSSLPSSPTHCHAPPPPPSLSHARECETPSPAPCLPPCLPPSPSRRGAKVSTSMPTLHRLQHAIVRCNRCISQSLFTSEGTQRDTEVLLCFPKEDHPNLGTMRQAQPPPPPPPPSFKDY